MSSLRVCLRVLRAFAVFPEIPKVLSAETQWRALRRSLVYPNHAKLIIDAIFGTGLTEAPRQPFPQIVDAVTVTAIPVLSIDLPSGMDCDTGQPLGACIRATQTVTFVAEKTGFANPAARPFLGKVIVADIGCPRELIAQIAEA